MSIVFQMDKSMGVQYAYDNEAYWSKGKNQSMTKSILIISGSRNWRNYHDTALAKEGTEETVVSVVKPVLLNKWH